MQLLREWFSLVVHAAIRKAAEKSKPGRILQESLAVRIKNHPVSLFHRNKSIKPKLGHVALKISLISIRGSFLRTCLGFVQVRSKTRVISNLPELRQAVSQSCQHRVFTKSWQTKSLWSNNDRLLALCEIKTVNRTMKACNIGNKSLSSLSHKTEWIRCSWSKSSAEALVKKMAAAKINTT